MMDEFTQVATNPKPTCPYTFILKCPNIVQPKSAFAIRYHPQGGSVIQALFIHSFPPNSEGKMAGANARSLARPLSLAHLCDLRHGIGVWSQDPGELRRCGITSATISFLLAQPRHPFLETFDTFATFNNIRHILDCCLRSVEEARVCGSGEAL